MINYWESQERGGVWDEAEVSNNNLDEWSYRKLRKGMVW